MSAQVIVLSGPSGAGKSRLARHLHAQHGWPVLPLDDFYREVGDPGLPMSPLGLPDWDDVRSWDLGAAVDALERLCTAGRTEVPVYDIATSSVTGRAQVELEGHTLVLAEGIFAAEVVAQLREAGVLHSAWCIHHRPLVTFVRRLARDLKERRKSPMVLVRRGLALMRTEPEVIRRQEALGARSARAKDVEARLAAAAAAEPRHG
jgi:uridine kinase